MPSHGFADSLASTVMVDVGPNTVMVDVEPNINACLCSTDQLCVRNTTQIVAIAGAPKAGGLAVFREMALVLILPDDAIVHGILAAKLVLDAGELEVARAQTENGLVPIRSP